MAEKRKKVLLITDSFPPRQGGASLRMRGLAKYLPRFGWDPTVLTVDLPADPDNRYRVIQVPYPGDVTEQIKAKLRFNPQEGLQDQIGIPTQVSLAKDPITGKIIKRIEGWLTYPDQKRRWKPVADAAIQDLLTRETFDALISSSPPEITHLIAEKASKEFGIPWVADFRDLWTGNHYYAYDAVRKFFDRRLEKKILSTAAALVTVSEPLCRTLRSLHRHKMVVPITNGYDPDEIKGSELDDKFSITYTGKLYQGKRDPEMLFKVIRELLDDNEIRGDLMINFYGPSMYWVDALIKKYNLEKFAFQQGNVERSTAVEEQRRSQVLLSLNWDNPMDEGVYTGKIFEYLAARRPILALGGPQGVVSDLLEETEAGVHQRTAGDLKGTISSWYQEYRESGSVKYHGNDKIYDYSHEKMAGRYADLFNSFSK
jgi:glycosyltransferase involved in cell wall biosynthesis